VIDLLEAAAPKEHPIMNRGELINLLQAQRPDLLTGVDPNILSDADLIQLPGKAIEGGKRLAEAVRANRSHQASRLRQEAAEGRIRGQGGFHRSRL